MNDRPTIFRQEAVESRATGPRVTGGPLRLDTPWVRWAYWAVLALVVAGVAAMMLVRTEATATGPAVLRPDGTFVAVVPAVIAPDLDDARSVRIESIDGAGGVRAVVTVDRVVPADDASVSRAGLPVLQQPALLLIGALADVDSSVLPSRAAQVDARAVVVIRSEPILSMLGRRVSGMLG